jgi:hypothetical protein
MASAALSGTPLLDGNQQSLLALLQQCQDALHVLEGQAGLRGDLLCGVALIPQLLDAGQQFQRPPLAPRDVLGQAHDEGVFVVATITSAGMLVSPKDLNALSRPSPQISR